MELTPRQADLILFIRNFKHLHGHSPTFREIAEALNISRATTVSHVKRLIKKKLVVSSKQKARTLEIVADMKKTFEP